MQCWREVGWSRVRHVVLDTAPGRAAGTGRRAMRGLREAPCQPAEAGSVSLGTDAFLSCRVQSPSARVARVNTALDNLCFTHISCSSAHNSHERCVVNSVGDTEDGDVASVNLGEHSHRV